MLSHHNLVNNIETLHALVDFNSGDRALSFLPLSHVLERMCTHAWLYVGACIAYAESLDTVADNLMEARPTIMVGVPRFLINFMRR